MQHTRKTPQQGLQATSPPLCVYPYEAGCGGSSTIVCLCCCYCGPPKVKGWSGLLSSLTERKKKGRVEVGGGVKAGSQKPELQPE